MDRLANHPKFQAFDSNGDPLSGGKLYTYAAGTTTNKTTYSDRALATPNANPVVLDSRGECVVYFSGTIKLVLKTSADVTVWTMDNLKAIDNTILSDDDADTMVQVEESADEDKIRFDTGGTERMLLDSTGLKIASNGVLAGDTTAGRVLRCAMLKIGDATTADEIKVSLLSVWNGDTIAEQDDLGKNETKGNFTLNAAGNVLTIEAAGLTGNCVAILSADIYANTKVAGLFCDYDAVANDATFSLSTFDGGAYDLTSMVDTAESVWVKFLYVTDA